jgi:hypothetical protein
MALTTVSTRVKSIWVLVEPTRLLWFHCPVHCPGKNWGYVRIYTHAPPTHILAWLGCAAWSRQVLLIGFELWQSPLGPYSRLYLTLTSLNLILTAFSWLMQFLLDSSSLNLTPGAVFTWFWVILTRGVFTRYQQSSLDFSPLLLHS